MDMHNSEMGADDKCSCGADCNCGHCHGGMKSQWLMMRAVRVLTAVIVIIFVFWCGFEFGMIRASVGNDFGYGMMRGGGSTIEYGMMRGGVTSVSAAVPATVVSTATAPAGGGGTNVK